MSCLNLAMGKQATKVDELRLRKLLVLRPSDHRNRRTLQEDPKVAVGDVSMSTLGRSPNISW